MDPLEKFREEIRKTGKLSKESAEKLLEVLETSVQLFMALKNELDKKDSRPV